MVAELVSVAEFKPDFVEANPEVVRNLKRSGEYRVHLVGKKHRNTHITNFEVFTISQTDEISEAISHCLFAAMAVGGPNLPSTSALMALGLQRRHNPLNILVCENWPHVENVMSGSLLANGINKDAVSIIRCSVERMVRRVESSLGLVAE